VKASLSVRPLSAILVLAISAPNIACVRSLPAPAEPKRVAPSLEDELPESRPGQGVVVLDSEGPPARVALVEGTMTASASVRGYRVSSYAVATRQLCDTTPCAAVLPQGQQQITFQGVEDGERVGLAKVKVGREPVVVRHAMGQQRSPGVVGTTGFWLGILGASALATGAIVMAASSDSPHTAGMRDAGRTVAFAGGAGLAVGVTMFFLDRPTRQEGSTVQFRVGPSAPSTTETTSGGLGLRNASGK
jgi:hypothetical protein